MSKNKNNKYSDIGFVDMYYGAPRILFEYAKSNRSIPTEAEHLLWKHLSNNKQKGFLFRQQHPVKYFIADFYCHKARLVIEVDGKYHDIPEQYQYDRERDMELENLGLTILHFTNEQVINHIEEVLEEINRVLPPTS